MSVYELWVRVVGHKMPWSRVACKLHQLQLSCFSVALLGRNIMQTTSFYFQNVFFLFKTLFCLMGIKYYSKKLQLQHCRSSIMSSLSYVKTRIFCKALQYQLASGYISGQWKITSGIEYRSPKNNGNVRNWVITKTWCC